MYRIVEITKPGKQPVYYVEKKILGLFWKIQNIPNYDFSETWLCVGSLEIALGGLSRIKDRQTKIKKLVVYTEEKYEKETRY